ncbi:MAG: YbaN family protein [Anaerocolumna sp.]
MKKIINIICLWLGFIALGIGMIGIVLPILPTTPFILLSAALFAKSSEKFHKWLLSTKVYTNYVGKWMESRSMTVKEKCKVLFIVTLLLGISIYVAPIWHAQVFILIILLGHYYFLLFRMKTSKEEKATVTTLENKID